MNNLQESQKYVVLQEHVQKEVKLTCGDRRQKVYL